MTTGFICPVEGCDFGSGGDRTANSVRTHINSKSGKDHEDTSRLRALVDEQNPGGDDGEESETSEEPEETGLEGTESEESEPEEADDEADDEPDEMATEDEYQQQQEGEPESTTDETDDEPATSGGGAAAAAAGGAGALSMFSDRSPFFWVGVALLALLVISMVTDGDGSTSDTNSTPGTDSQPSTPTEAAEKAGGLE